MQELTGDISHSNHRKLYSVHMTVQGKVWVLVVLVLTRVHDRCPDIYRKKRVSSQT